MREKALFLGPQAGGVYTICCGAWPWTEAADSEAAGTETAGP